MALNTYVVVFTKGAEKGVERVISTYDNAYKLQDDVVLVASNDLSSQIAESSALTKDQEKDGVRGAVFKLNGSYTGYAPSALWEWLENVEASL